MTPVKGKKYRIAHDIFKVYKERGVTSAYTVQKIKSLFHAKKAGHAGTLDPLAEGLLIVGIESGTKKLARFMRLPKTYEVRIILGVTTNTHDREGKITREVAPQDTKRVTLQQVLQATTALQGCHFLPVPLYSAIKRGGKPLYWYARRGINIRRPYTHMHVYDSRLIRFTKEKGRYPRATLRLIVSRGTYVRSLSELFGSKLQLPSCIETLTRTAIGSYNIRDSLRLDK